MRSISSREGKTPVGDTSTVHRLCCSATSVLHVRAVCASTAALTKKSGTQVVSTVELALAVGILPALVFEWISVNTATSNSAAQAENDDSEDKDPPQTIPPRFEQCAWGSSMHIVADQSVMIWTTLSRRGQSAPSETWHQAKIVRELAARSGTAACFFYS
eukprot:6176390-Pleurochrysis_carterae.AAC.1